MAAKSRYTPRKQPSQARAKRTWEAILDGAAQVLVAQGYENATTDRIAERTGVSVGTLYEYFPNKDAVFAALQLRWNEQRWHVFESNWAIELDDCLETVLRKTIRARIKATNLNPLLNSKLLHDVPTSVTAEQALALHDQFLNASLLMLNRFKKEIRTTDLTLMAKLMIHATHAVIDNVAVSQPHLLESQNLEDELVLLMLGYVRK